MSAPTNDSASDGGNRSEAENQTRLQLEFSSASHAAVKTWPSNGSIKRQILDALLAGESINSLQAWMRFGTSRLAGLIHQLRRDGWPIRSKAVDVSTATGRQAHIVEYLMEGGDETS